jgi:hypothetical protein
MILDPQSAGIAGDMFIGALLDIGADFKKIEEALGSVKEKLGRYEVRAGKVVKSGISATKYGFNVREREISYVEAVKIIKNADISEKAQKFALQCLDTLASAESKVHGIDKTDVHLHEASDAVADFIAAAVCLDDLGLFDARWLSLPVNTGKGFFKFHGQRFSLPAPAVVEILKGRPVFGDIGFELTTPTGAAILNNLVDSFIEEFPLAKIKEVGYGAGAKEFESPNVFRIFLCEELDFGLIPERIAVLETNIDDVSGEVLGYTLEKLIEAGAKDVSIIPCIMKKNRPGNILKVISAQEDAKRLAKVIVEETGSLGVRVLPITHRYTLKREVVEKEVKIKGKRFKVRFKTASDRHGTELKSAPEFEDLKKIAEKTGLSVRELKEICERL